MSCVQQGHTARPQQRRLRRRAVTAQHIHIRVPIVCGLGRNGRQVVSKLKAYGVQVVVLELEEERANRYRAELDGVVVLIGDATNDEILEKANITHASGLVAALASDTDNLFVVISARQLNPKLVIGARANTESTEKKLLAAGANYTVSPNLVGGSHLAHNLMNPGVMNFLDHLSVGGSSATNIEEIVVDELPRNNRAACARFPCPGSRIEPGLTHVWPQQERRL